MGGRTSDGRNQRKMTDWTNLDYVVVDVEGNGQQPPDLVELAAVPIVGGVIGEPVSWLVRPDRPITPMARRIHSITNEAVADAPVFEDIKVDVLLALSHPALVAHNAHVDVGVLRRKLAGWECPEVFDTLKLSRRFLPNQVSHRLGSLVEAFKLAEGLSPELKPHRATYDALVTARLFQMLATTGSVPRLLEDLRGQPSGGGGDEAATLF
jgi:DNA polymerase III epsilon subunit-like protein